MTLQELKLDFFTELNQQYPATEIESFFYWLTQSELNISRLEMALDPQKEIDITQIESFKKAINRLKNFEPIQYIVGETEFYGCLIKVNPSVLIPRPETEELVAWMVEDLKDKKEPFKILDIGTGSGCIPISLAKSLPQAAVSSIDISAEAIQTAKDNAKINRVKVEFLQQDILKTEKLNGKFDVIVSNPPYVRELEKKMMQENVLNYEPGLALFVSDEDPLIFYKKIAELAFEALPEKGILYLEINEYLAEEMKLLLKGLGFKKIEMKKDIFGKYRMCKAFL